MQGQQMTAVQKLVRRGHQGDLLHQAKVLCDKQDNSPLHVGISLRSALKGTLSGSLSGTLADESWKSPLIEDKKYN